MTYGEDVGIPKELLPKIGTGFGGGFAHKGLTCGVLNAATILLSAKYGRITHDDGNLPVNFEKVKQFFEAFKNEYGSVYCKGITKTNFEKDDKFPEWLAAGGRNKCSEIVKFSAKLYESLT